MQPLIPFAIAYLITAIAITGWMFALLHRDGVTDSFEWQSDRKFAAKVGAIFGFGGPFSIILFWIICDKGWTLKPDKLTA